MDLLLPILSWVPALMWLGLLAVPWRPWLTDESWEADEALPDSDLSDLTVLIPARNEEVLIAETLEQFEKQGKGCRVIVVDDGSEDGTYEVARKYESETIRVIRGEEPKEGWGGKLWALEQGRCEAETPFLLLLDADIGLREGSLPSLVKRMKEEQLDMLSLMAKPPFERLWERLLMPAFIYYFKLLYPFALANSDSSARSAGAGGCLLIRAEALERSGGFEAIRGTLIDDCSLAANVKRSGFRIWIGLTHSIWMRRPYDSVMDIGNMIARTAYFQLRYSPLLLLCCTLIMLIAYWGPFVALLYGDGTYFILGWASLVAMCLAYLPTVAYYERPMLQCLSIPAVAIFYLCMTWLSAIRYYRGERWRWRGRVV